MRGRNLTIYLGINFTCECQDHHKIKLKKKGFLDKMFSKVHLTSQFIIDLIFIKHFANLFFFFFRFN